MMRTMVRSWALVLGCALCASGWAQEAVPEPFEVVEAFIEAYNRGDLEDTRSLIVPEILVASHWLYWDVASLDELPVKLAGAVERRDRYEVELLSVYGDRAVLTRDRYWIGGQRYSATTLWVVWGGRLVGKTSVIDGDATFDAMFGAHLNGTWHAPGGGPVAVMHYGQYRFAFAEELDALSDPHDLGSASKRGDEVLLVSGVSSRLCEIGDHLRAFVRFVDMDTLELVPRGDACADRWPGSETLRYTRVTGP